MTELRFTWSEKIMIGITLVITTLLLLLIFLLPNFGVPISEQAAINFALVAACIPSLVITYLLSSKLFASWKRWLSPMFLFFLEAAIFGTVYGNNTLRYISWGIIILILATPPVAAFIYRFVRSRQSGWQGNSANKKTPKGVTTNRHAP
jgi:hypothetical protein